MASLMFLLGIEVPIKSGNTFSLFSAMLAIHDGVCQSPFSQATHHESVVFFAVHPEQACLLTRIRHPLRIIQHSFEKLLLRSSAFQILICTTLQTILKYYISWQFLSGSWRLQDKRQTNRQKEEVFLICFYLSALDLYVYHQSNYTWSYVRVSYGVFVLCVSVLCNWTVFKNKKRPADSCICRVGN